MKTSQNAWSAYWETGFLTTFGSDKAENYSGMIRGFWDNEFSNLKSGARILDCGAGNGALLAIAMDCAVQAKRHFDCIAVDIADIRNTGQFYKDYPQIQVHGNTSIENMDVPTGTIDLCVSQYGFEYSNVSEALKEIFRVLKDKGRFSALIHHEDSFVTQASKLALDQVKICESSGLDEITEKLLRRLDKLRKSKQDPIQDTIAANLRDEFNNTASELLNHDRKTADQDHIQYYLRELSGLFGRSARQMTINDKVGLIENIREQSKLYNMRMLSMVNASMGAVDIDDLQRLAKKVGFKLVQCEVMTHGSQVAAWKFVISKSK